MEINRLPTLVKIGQAAKTLGVSIKTLRRWEKAGKIHPIYTPGGTRLYSLEQLQGFSPKQGPQQKTWHINPEKFQRAKTDTFPHQTFSFLAIGTLFLLLSFAITTPQFHAHKLAQKSKGPVLGLSTQSAQPSLLESLSSTISSILFPSPTEQQDTKISQLEGKITKLEEVISTQSSSLSSLATSYQLPATISTLDPKTTYTDILGQTIIDSGGNIYPAQTTVQKSLSKTPPSLGTWDHRFYGLFANNFDVTPQGNFTVLGSSTLGGQRSDYVKILGAIASDLVPSSNNNSALGSSDYYFKSGYVSSVVGNTLNYQTVTAGVLNASSTVTLNGATTINNNLSVTGTSTITGATTFTGGLLLPDGSASTPALRFTNDTDSGLYRISNNVISLITGGAAGQGITVDSSGNVGVGTTAPARTLEIYAASAPKFSITSGNIAHGMTARLGSTDELFGIREWSNGGAWITTASSDGSTQGLIWESFIGSTDPTDSIPAIELRGGKKGAGTNVAALGSSETVFQIDNYGTDLITVLGNGNFGINQTGPSRKLHVVGNAYFVDSTNYAITNTSDNFELFTNVSAAVGVGPKVDFGGWTSGGDLADVFASIKGAQDIADQYKGYLAFATLSAASTPLERMRIDSAGNVGIGTTNPGSKLEVNGDVKATSFNGNTFTAGTGILTLGASKTLTASDTTTLATNSITFAGGEVLTLTATNALTLTTTGTTDVTLPTTGTLATLGGTETFSGAKTFSNATYSALFTGGNVGIGTTAPGSELEIYSTDSSLSGVKFSSSTAGTTYSVGVGDGTPYNDALIFVSNTTQYAFMNSSGNWGYGFAGTPGSRLSVSGNLSLGSSYVTIAAPTNGAIIEGNVGIGTTNPSAALSVAENFKVTSDGVVTGGTYNKVAITAPATSATLTITDGKTLATSDTTTLATNSITFGGGEVLTLTASNALTLATTGTTSVTLPTTGILATLAGIETFTNKTLTSPKLNEDVALTSTSTKLNYLTSAGGTTGTTSTNIVFSTSPTLVTPVLGAASATSLTAATLYGGTAADSTLTLAGTSNGTPASAHILLNTSGQGVVAIGTTAPATYTQLEIDGANQTVTAGARANLIIRTSDDPAQDAGGSLGFAGWYRLSNPRNWQTFGVIVGRKENGDDNNSAGYLAFLTAPNALNPLERMRIASDGNVGIGTTNPGALVDVGLAGTTLGVIRLEGSTSGYANLQPTAAAGNITLTLPAATDTLVGKATTDTLTNKTLTSPVISTSPTAAGATWADLGTVTTADINGGTIDGVTIGGASAGAGTFTTLTASSTLTLSGSAANIALGSNYLSGDGGDEGIYIDSGGNVGIGGATTQGNRLEVIGNGGILVQDDSASSNGNTIGIDFRARTDAFYPSYLGGIYGITPDKTVESGGLVFYTNNAGVSGEKMRINPAGNVGIGTTDPGYKLAVNGSFNSTSIYNTGRLEGNKAGNDTISVANSHLWIGDESLNAGLLGQQRLTSPYSFTLQAQDYTDGGSFFPLSFQVEGGNVGVGTISPGAKFDVNATCTSFQTSHQCTDYAELYPSSEGVDYGEVLVIDKSTAPDPIVKKSNSSYQKEILGIVSTKPAVVIEGNSVQLMTGANYNLDPHKPAVALAGRVPTKVSIENGPIEVGDYLTSSSIPGVAMKATRPGPTVGKALESYSGSGIGKILVFVNVSYADPGDVLANLSIDSDGSLVTKSIKTEAVTLTSSLPSTPSVPSVDVKAELASLKTQVASLSAQVATLEASSSATPLDNLVAQAATSSSTLTTSYQLLTTYDATISGTLKALGDTFLGNTLIAGDLIVDGTLSLNGDSISSIGTLFIQRSPLSTLIDIFNGKVQIDNSGKVSMQKLAVSSDVLGTATIPAGQNLIVVSTDQVTDKSKVFITPHKPVTIAVTAKDLTTHTFTVELGSTQPQDLEFDWWIVDQR